eukprot:5591300-Amphidinium_carterae.1
MSSTCWTSVGRISIVTREVYIKLPKKDPKNEEDDICVLLHKAVNEVRDAAQAFEQRVRRLCAETGARQGAFYACTYYHTEWKAVFIFCDNELVCFRPLATVWVVPLPRPSSLRRKLPGTVTWWSKYERTHRPLRLTR